MSALADRERDARQRAEDEELGAAILATDGSPAEVMEVMRGRPFAFLRMDRADGFFPVPEWHARLRRARNADGFFRVLNNREDWTDHGGLSLPRRRLSPRLQDLAARGRAARAQTTQGPPTENER